MFKFSCKLAIVLATVAAFAVATSSVMARGGGHGGFHGGGHHGGFHGHHPFHPSQHHFDHHNVNRDHHANFNHHHHVWHHGGWGPGFWGGAALGYGLGYGNWGYGGYTYDGDNTYIQDTSDVSTDFNNSDDIQDGEEGGDANYTNNTPISNGNRVAVAKAPFDSWPELGIVTYAGQYGGTLGQVVVRVIPGSAAARAGIVAGDVILTLNGQPTPSADSVEAILENANVQFTAEVWDARTGRKSTLSGTLDPNAPKSDKTAAATQR